MENGSPGQFPTASQVVESWLPTADGSQVTSVPIVLHGSNPSQVCVLDRSALFAGGAFGDPPGYLAGVGERVLIDLAVAPGNFGVLLPLIPGGNIIGQKVVIMQTGIGPAGGNLVLYGNGKVITATGFAPGSPSILLAAVGALLTGTETWTFEYTGSTWNLVAQTA